MPFQKTGPCPFVGGHWPDVWEQKITPKTFDTLEEVHRRDLIEYFYERESAVTPEHPLPAYRFPLNKLTDYTGIGGKEMRNAVLSSAEYKRYVEEHQPQMSMLTRARIAECLRCPPRPAAAEDDGARIRELDRWQREHASEAQVLRKSDRERKGILFSEGLPLNNEKYVSGKPEDNYRHKPMGPEWGRNRAMVCNIQRVIEAAANEMLAQHTLHEQQIFATLEAEEKEKAKTKGEVHTDARAPYKARAALGLVLLLTSVLGYHLIISVSVVIFLTWHSFSTVSLRSSRITRRKTPIGAAPNRGCNSKDITGNGYSNSG